MFIFCSYVMPGPNEKFMGEINSMGLSIQNIDTELLGACFCAGGGGGPVLAIAEDAADDDDEEEDGAVVVLDEMLIAWALLLPEPTPLLRTKF